MAFPPGFHFWLKCGDYILLKVIFVSKLNLKFKDDRNRLFGNLNFKSERQTINMSYMRFNASTNIMTDLKTMTDVSGSPEEERQTDFYYQPWAQEAVCRYFYQKIQQKRSELDSALGLRTFF